MEQDMHMVVRPVDRDRFNSLVMADAGHIGPKLGLYFFRNELVSFFGAEDQVDVDAGKGMGHVSPLRGSYCIFPLTHRLRGGLSNSARYRGLEHRQSTNFIAVIL